MGGMFYTKNADCRTIVVTWLGDEVSQDVQIKNNVLTFQRNAMTFRGRLRKDEDCFAFKRIEPPAATRPTEADARSSNALVARSRKES